MVREAITTVSTIILLLIGVQSAMAATPDRQDSVCHRLSVEIRPAYNLISHHYFRGNNPNQRILNKSLSLHAKYAFSFAPTSRIGKLYPTAYQGVGIAAYTYFAHDSVGTPIAAYIFQGARIADLTEHLSLGYEWNLGVSWGWHPNSAMNSRCNVMVSVALPFTWRVSPHWEIALTPDFTHFSNGDTSFSNSGSNLFGIRLGATYLFNDDQSKAIGRGYISKSERYTKSRFAQRMSYDIVAYGGVRADRFTEGGQFFLINKPFAIGGLHLMPLYHLNDYFSIGGSMDIHIDSSANLYGAVTDTETYELISFSHPPLWQQTAIGISLRAEINAPIFTIGVGAGYNIVKHGYDMQGYYTSFSLKAFITKQLFIYIGYRLSSKQYTHNMMYGIGIRL